MPGHIPPDSGAPYIIICSTRIAVAATSDSKDKLNAVSKGASELASYYSMRLRSTLDNAKLLPISTLQHEIMDDIGMSKSEAEVKCEQMLALMDQLEHDLGSGSY
jgi:hypothetical protein